MEKRIKSYDFERVNLAYVLASQQCIVVPFSLIVNGLKT